MTAYMKTKKPSEKHRSFRMGVVRLLKKYAGELDAQDMLALSSHLVGQLLAMQDQRKLTKELALDIVMANIELGNREAVTNLLKSKGKA